MFSGASQAATYRAGVPNFRSVLLKSRADQRR
jgi:hypothetical protein